MQMRFEFAICNLRTEICNLQIRICKMMVQIAQFVHQETAN